MGTPEVKNKSSYNTARRSAHRAYAPCYHGAPQHFAAPQYDAAPEHYAGPHYGYYGGPQLGVGVGPFGFRVW